MQYPRTILYSRAFFVFKMLVLTLRVKFLKKRTGNRKQTHAIQKYRDIVRQVTIDNTEEYLARIIVGIEEQSEVYYAMPVRNMLYDALNYSRQVSGERIQYIRYVRAGIGRKKGD